MLAGMRDRVGNETTYSYQNRLLTKMVDLVGLETIFTYSGSKIASITPPEQVTTLGSKKAWSMEKFSCCEWFPLLPSTFLINLKYQSCIPLIQKNRVEKPEDPSNSWRQASNIGGWSINNRSPTLKARL